MQGLVEDSVALGAAPYLARVVLIREVARYREGLVLVECQILCHCLMYVRVFVCEDAYAVLSV